jgi:hypothetical protein
MNRRLSETNLPQLNANVLEVVKSINVWIILEICEAQESALAFHKLNL